MYHLLLMLSGLLHCAHGASPHSKLLIVSFDGFRYDFLNRNLTPNFNNLMEKSVHVSQLENVFPTQTFPNHFSIVTGLYAENHGVLASKVFSAKDNQTLSYSYELFHYNATTLPIWALNEKAGGGRHSGSMMWTGGEFAYNNTKATFTQQYTPNSSWQKSIDTVMSWFTNKTTPANLVNLYFDQPDSEEHIFGPNSNQTNEQIKRVDDTVKSIMDGLIANNLTDVNVVFLSDHGMEAVTKSRIIDLSSVIEQYGFSIGTSPVFQIYPNPGQFDNMYNSLKVFSNENKHFDVYLKAEVPESLRYKNCERAPPIVAVARPQYAFQDLLKIIEKYSKLYNITVTNSTEFGLHGYDPKFPNMHPFMVAHGPLFKSGLTVAKAKTVDLYSMFAHVLGLELGSYRTDGSFDKVSMFFTTGAANGRYYLTAFIVLAVIISAMIALAARPLARYKSTNSLYQRLDTEDPNGITEEEA